MYVPQHFAAPGPETVRRLLAEAGACELVTHGPDGLAASTLPMLYEPPGDGAGHGSLLGHLARNNPQWTGADGAEALVIARGPDAYVTPSWYASKREHGRTVPTWNYTVVHAHGRLVVHDDPAWLEGVVRRLTERHEADRPEPWSVDNAPARYIAGQLRAIVGVEVRIERLEAKLKLSQNRSDADIDGVIAGLEAGGGDGQRSTAREMRAARRPH